MTETAPIQLTSKEDSESRVLNGVLAVQRGLRERTIPPGCVDGLKGYGGPDLENFCLGSCFHLEGVTSQNVVKVFDFSTTKNTNVLYLRCIHNSMVSIKTFLASHYTLDIDTGIVDSKESVNGRRVQAQFTKKLPKVPNTRSLLREHWFNARKWLQEGRLKTIRPKDLEEIMHADLTELPAHFRSVAQCSEGLRRLERGFTLLLTQGELIKIPIPWHPDRPLLCAGLLFKEGQPQLQPNNPRRPDGLSFIFVATGFRGVDLEGRLVGGSYHWDEDDVYEYIPGRWEPC